MRAVLFDLDGVFYESDRPIPGAADVAAWVRNDGIPHLFLTNTTSKDRKALSDKLQKMGVPAQPDELLTPPVAARNWLQAQSCKTVALFVPEVTAAEFADFSVVDDETTAVDAVVIGDLGHDWTFARLNRAFRLLKQEPAPALLALGMTRYWKTPEGLQLDVGAMVSALTYASGVEPVVLGKPAAAFYQAALNRLGVPADEAVMIGDDIRGDVGGAQSAGIAGILVRTGKFRDADLRGDIKPDAVLDSVADLPDWWRAH